MEWLLVFIGQLAVVAAIAYLLMWMRGRLAGKAAAGQDPLQPRRDVPALPRSLAQPAVQITTEEPQPNSHFGGFPPVFPGFLWPTRKGRPLSFLACVDLSEVPRSIDWLPTQGRLLFFYDVEEQPWGFDPKDRDGWKVVYVAHSTPVSGDAPRPRDISSESAIARRGMGFHAAEPPPTSDAQVVKPFDLDDAEPHHHIGGYPDPIQFAEMELECQLASNGVYVDSSAYKSAKADDLQAGAADWRLLLQVDSDDDLGLMWGDGGRLYFWVREQEAREGNFDNVWLILQCY